jgi:RimJ/RimL family protein N-acetyltransferase
VICRRPKVLGNVDEQNMNFISVASRLHRMAGIGFQRMYVYKKSKPDVWSAGAVNDNNMKWEPLLPERVDQILEVRRFDLNKALRRLRDGDCCYTVSVGDRMAHYSWVQRAGNHQITKAGISALVKNGDFWIYDCRTAGWAEGKGIYSSTLKRIVEDHFAAGYSTAWIYTRAQNAASQRGILRAGFDLAAIFRAFRLGDFYFPLNGDDESNSIRSQLSY